MRAVAPASGYAWHMRYGGLLFCIAVAFPMAGFGCGDDESSSPPAGAGGTGGSGTGENRDECLASCSVEYPVAWPLVAQHFIDECLCAVDAPCRTECDENVWCGGPTTEATLCNACTERISNDSPCNKRVADECYADADCAPVVGCIAACPD